FQDGFLDDLLKSDQLADNALTAEHRGKPVVFLNRAGAAKHVRFREWDAYLVDEAPESRRAGGARFPATQRIHHLDYLGIVLIRFFDLIRRLLALDVRNFNLATSHQLVYILFEHSVNADIKTGLQKYCLQGVGSG